MKGAIEGDVLRQFKPGESKLFGGVQGKAYKKVTAFMRFLKVWRVAPGKSSVQNVPIKFGMRNEQVNLSVGEMGGKISS